MNTRARVTVSVWLLSLLVCLGIIARTPFTTDMSAFLPRAPLPEQRFLVDQVREGVASRLLLVAIDGATPAVRTAISQALAARLARRPDFVWVESGTEGVGPLDTRYVWNNRYLLSPAVDAERFSAHGLRRALLSVLELLSSSMEPLLKQAITHDPTGEALSVAGVLAGEATRGICDGVWCSPDGNRALLLVRTRAAGFDIDGQEKALAALRQDFAAARLAVSGGGAAQLVASGPGVFAVKTRDDMKHDVSLYSGIAVLAIVGVLLFVYRSPWVLALTLAPVVSATLAGLAAVSLLHGYVHGITVGFGVTLIGEAVDYAVYLFIQGKADTSTKTTLERIWPTLRLGGLLSILGFSAMLFSSFTGFVQLGVFTVAGIGSALAVTRYVLPNLAPAHPAESRKSSLPKWLILLIDEAPRLRLALVLLSVAAAAAVFWRGEAVWQDNLLSMSPIAAAEQHIDTLLRRDIGAPDVSNLIIVTAADQETVLTTCENLAVILQELVGAGVLSGYDSPARYLPSRLMQEQRRAALPDQRTLADNLRQALVGLPFRADIFRPFLADVATAKGAVVLERSALDETKLSLKLDSLLVQRDHRWIAALPLRGLVNPQRVAAALPQPPVGAGATEIKLLDLKTETDQLLRHYRREALLLNLCGSVAMAMLIYGFFRNLRQTLVVLAPLLVAIILTVAMLTLPDGRISVFHLFGLLMVVAVGSNYCLFFNSDGMAGVLRGATLGSLLVANLCTVLGFGALSFSRLPVLYDIGHTVAIGTALSLVAAVVLAPRGRYPPAQINFKSTR